MKKLILSVLFALATFVAFSQPANVTVGWDANCNTNVAGYAIYYGVSTNVLSTPRAAYTDDCGVFRPATTNVYHQPYTNSVLVTGRTNTSVTISNLVRGVTYRFAAVSRSTTGLESDYSAEVSYTPPILPPTPVQNFRLLSAP